MSKAQLALGGVSLNTVKIGGTTPERNYFTPGEYLVEIVAIKLILRRKQKDFMFIAETKIIESEGAEAKPKGKLVAWTMKMHLDAAGQNIKEFLVAASGIDPANTEAVDGSDEDWDAIYLAALEDDQPFRGTRLRVSASNRTAESGNEYVRCRFLPAAE